MGAIGQELYVPTGTIVMARDVLDWAEVSLIDMKEMGIKTQTLIGVANACRCCPQRGWNWLHGLTRGVVGRPNHWCSGTIFSESHARTHTTVAATNRSEMSSSSMMANN